MRDPLANVNCVFAWNKNRFESLNGLHIQQKKTLEWNGSLLISMRYNHSPFICSNNVDLEMFSTIHIKVANELIDYYHQWIKVSLELKHRIWNEQLPSFEFMITFVQVRLILHMLGHVFSAWMFTYVICSQKYINNSFTRMTRSAAFKCTVHNKSIVLSCKVNDCYVLLSRLEVQFG